MNIDWKAVHNRMAAAQEVLERGAKPSRSETAKILKTRAQALAREPEAEAEDHESIDILEFVVAEEKYGIEVSYIGTVHSLSGLTPLPGLPPFVLGVVNVRGQIVSVVDLKKMFELPDKGLSDLNRVIIVRGPTLEFGILADVIVGIRSIRLKEIQPELPTLTGIRQEYLQGVTGERLIILDASRLMDDKALVVHEGSRV